jgi:hypothetical protein
VNLAVGLQDRHGMKGQVCFCLGLEDGYSDWRATTFYTRSFPVKKYKKIVEIKVYF